MYLSSSALSALLGAHFGSCADQWHSHRGFHALALFRVSLPLTTTSRHATPPISSASYTLDRPFSCYSGEALSRSFSCGCVPRVVYDLSVHVWSARVY
jgi:hypothetical protein